MTVYTVRGKETEFAGNSIGACTYNGGIIILTGNSPDLLGAAMNSCEGGIIVKRNGTLQ